MTAGLGLFGRMVAVELGVPGTPGIRLEGLRVGFRVDHKASKTVSTGTVRIWNPAPTSIARMRIPGASVRLFVGYEPAPRLLFWGQPVRDGLNVATEGPDTVLEIDAADGGGSYASTFLQLSYSTPTTFEQVIAEVLLRTGWARGTIAVPPFTFPHGLVLLGRPAEVMDRVAAAVAADWYIRDSALYVVVKGTSTPEVAPVISATQGNLIGSPTTTVTSATSAISGGVKARALIDASMRPGRSFVVESRTINGIYIASDVSFTGDSGFSNDFYMDLTGKPAGSV